MSYIIQSESPSPFATVKCSGTQTIPQAGAFKDTPAFDVPDKEWAEFNTSTKGVDTGIDTLSFSALVADNINVAVTFYYYNDPNSEDYLRAMAVGESQYTSAGWTKRGDDISIKVGDTHKVRYTSGVGVNNNSGAADTDRSVMYLMTIGS